MQRYFLFSLILLIMGCTRAPEISFSNELLAKQKIQENKKNAKQAQDEYLKLQEQRNKE